MQLGERTMLDLLDGEQELLQSELDLAYLSKIYLLLLPNPLS